MECDLCMRAASSDLPFYCPTCARSFLYDLHLRKAKILLERERLASRIERLTSGEEATRSRTAAKTAREEATDGNLKWSLESNKVKRAQAEERIQGIRKHNQILRDGIEMAREDITRRKATLGKKREYRSNIQAEVSERQGTSSDTLKTEIKRTAKSWGAIHDEAVQTRRFLCKEAAHLGGLKQRKKVKGGLVRDQYWIGGTPVIVLKDINNAKSSELTTSMTNVARLVVLVSFYLSVRLPAEIVLPQRDYPLPMIFTPANSYQGRGLHFPGTTPTASSSHNPVASRHADPRPLPRPRPLFVEVEHVDDKIPHMAKTDPASFSFFLEGISLLAWDIAWLCRSQGMYTGTESWQDVCNMGRNLWSLLIAPPQSAALLRVLAVKDSSQDSKTSSTGLQDTSISATSATTLGADKSLRLGHFSHDSAHSFANHGADLVRGWKLNKYSMIVDPLKKALLGEMSNAEWEMLEQDEWEDGGEQFRDHEAVYIKKRTDSSIVKEDGTSFDKRNDNTLGNDGPGSIMTARVDQRSEEPRTVNDTIPTVKAATDNISSDAEASANAAASKAKGTSGWTKLKSRGK